MEVAAKPVYSYLIAMLEAGGPTMLLTEAIYGHSCRLPEQATREALSYIELLEDRYRSLPTLMPKIRSVFLQRSPEG